MRRTFDALIVGGGPAGLTLAIALAKASPKDVARVAILEKSRYPREKFCAGALGGRGDRILAKLDARADVPSVFVEGMSYRASSGSIEARVGRTIGRVVRRIELDHALARLAAARGATIVEGAKVERVELGDERAIVETTEGAFDAKLLVGADGVGSVVRRAMGLTPGAVRAQVLEIDTEPVASDRARDLLHFESSIAELPGYTWDFPTIVDGRALVCRGIYHLKTDDRAIDLQAMFAKHLATIGLDLAAYKNKRFAERGYAPREGVARGRAILVGEAAGIDGVTGEGIAQAIEYGALAGPFLARCLAGDARPEAWETEVARSRLARDLGARTWCAKGFFSGERRAWIERLFLRDPAILRAGSLHFAGLRQEPLTLARAAAAIGAHWVVGG